jgi:hypothetical protein
MKRPLHLVRAMIAGGAIAASAVTACALAWNYTPGEVVAVSLGVACIMLVMFVTMWLINRQRTKHE